MSGWSDRSLGRSRRWCAPAAVVFACMALAAPHAFGQADTEASIIGTVTDESGAVLPGVTVTATSPALQVRQVSTVTDARGEYRLSGIPIGIYEVTYSSASRSNGSCFPTSACA